MERYGTVYNGMERYRTVWSGVKMGHNQTKQSRNGSWQNGIERYRTGFYFIVYVRIVFPFVRLFILCCSRYLSILWYTYAQDVRCRPRCQMSPKMSDVAFSDRKLGLSELALI